MDPQSSMKRIHLLGAALAVFLVIAAGCGTKTSSTNQTMGTPTNKATDVIKPDVNLNGQGNDVEKKVVLPSTTAKYITAVPLDLTQIERISKYRSCAGHDRSGYSFAGVFESDRSMKHYVYPVKKFQGTTNAVKLFAPFDGTVATINPEKDNVGGRPKGGHGIGFSTPVDPNVIFQFGHIYFVKDFVVGDSVKAGELVGYAALGNVGNDFDLDLLGTRLPTSGAEVLGSIFEHLSPAVEAAFAKVGITPDTTSWSAEYRDAHPCYYNQPAKQDPTLTGRNNVDWVVLKK